MKIFYIEDNKMNMRLVQKMLKCEYDVSGAYTGEDGLQQVNIVQPDLILLDINLPDINGFQVLKKLRENKQYDHIPVVALTANAMYGDKEKILESGFDAYLAKPVTSVELRNMIMHLVNIPDRNLSDETLPSPELATYSII